MSEFGESTHLRTSDPAVAAAAMRSAGLQGWVLPPTSGWVTVVVDAPFASRPDVVLASSFDGVVLHYLNAEDHGWGCWVHEGGEQRSAYEAEWTFDIEIDDTDLDVDAMVQVLGATGVVVDRAALEALLRPEDLEADLEALGANPGHRFAALLGLPAYEWLSAAGLARGDDDRSAERID